MDNHPFRSQTFFNLNQETRIFEDTYLVPSDRGPCPVCGHPTGDCVGTTPPPKVIFGQGSSEILASTQTILVEEDIYEERQITHFHKAKVLLHKKGSYVPYAEAIRLGLVENHLD
jgi:hypothetical protein